MKTFLQSLSIAIMFVCGFQSLGMALTAREKTSSRLLFNFITPGARATALGGTFIGLADDATAVESNPAGLTQLLASEISAEFKYFHLTTEHEAEEFSVDVLDNEFIMKEFGNSVATVPFVSYVYPYKRFVFSVYRQQLVNYKDSYRVRDLLVPLIFGVDFVAIEDTLRDVTVEDTSMRLTVTNYGIGTAIQISDRLSLAVSPRWSWMNMKLRQSIFMREAVLVDNLDDLDFSENDLNSETIIDDDDSGFSLNAGLLWNPYPKISIGAVYKTGTEFKVKQTLGRSYAPIYLNPEYIYAYDSDFVEFTLKIPDSFGVGFAFRATDFLTITLDVVHIQYKDLLKDFDVLSWPWSVTTEEDNYTVNNATETHLGVEYLLMFGKKFLALRAGVYNDPAHNIRYVGRHNEGLERDYPRGDDQIHVTGGLGFVLSDRFQIDTAVDIANKRKQFSVSTVYRFGQKKPKMPEKKPEQILITTPEPVEEVRPSVTFTIVKFEKTLEIQEISTDTPGVNDVNVTVKQAGKTKFVVTAALEKDQQTFTTDIEIRIGFQSFTVKAMDERAQVKVLSEKGKTLEVMVTFGE